MRVRRFIEPINWKLAIGEVVLIVFGIWIALGADAWNTARKRREDQLWILRELRGSLVADVQALDNTARRLKNKEARIDSLLVHLDQRTPYDKHFDRLFGAVYGVHSAQLNTSLYDMLEGRGLDLIASDSLRLGLVEVFERRNRQLERADNLLLDVSLAVLRPYFLTHFHNIVFNESASPLNFQTVSADPYFRNIAEYRLTVLRRSTIPAYENAVTASRALLMSLDREIARLR
jgi:hypothetical protein